MTMELWSQTILDSIRLSIMQDQARRAGRDNALQTVASVAISADKKDKNNDVDDFDIFSDKEKQLLNMS